MDEDAFCENADGQQIACFRTLPILLSRSLGRFSPARNEDGSADLKLRLRYRAPQQESNSRMEVYLQGYLASVTLNIPQNATGNGWQLLEGDVHIPANEDGAANNPWQSDGSINLDIFFRTGFWGNINDYLEIDAWEIYDGSGDLLNVPVSVRSFSEDQTTSPTGYLGQAGDWAVTTIERMGAIAWWGSSSHYLTGGHAFSDTESFLRTFFRGNPLGQALAHNNHLASGLIFGDPLLQPSAAALFVGSGENGYEDYSGVTNFKIKLNAGTSPSAATKLYLLAFHGKAHLADTVWELKVCEDESSPYECTSKNSWRDISNGQASLSVQSASPGGVDIYDIISDKSKKQKVHLMLKVYQQEKESEALYDYFSYQLD
ncbi:MAG: hypothetical protein R3A80_00755 [Bdellovibrionota bacterium]